MIETLLLSTLLLASAGPAPMTEAVRALVEELSLDTLPRRPSGPRLALTVSRASGASPSPDEEIAIVQALVLGRVAAVLGVPASIVSTLDDAEAEARARGASWLIRVTLRESGTNELLMSARLIPVDQGLWATAIHGETAALHAFSEQRAVRPARAPELAAGPGPKDTGPVDDLRPPVTLASFGSRVLSLASCPLGSAAQLFVLTRSELFWFVIETRGARRLAGFDLRAIPASRQRSREPLGLVSCSGLDDATIRLWVAHSDLAVGLELSAQRASGSRPPSSALSTVRQFELMPLGETKEGLLFGRFEASRGRWAAAVFHGPTSKSAFTPLPSPLLDLSSVGGVALPGYVLAVDSRYRLLALSKDGVEELSKGTSGVGASASLSTGELLTLSTSSAAVDSGDLLRLGTLKARDVRTVARSASGQFFATLILPMEGEVLLVWSTWDPGARVSRLEAALATRRGHATARGPRERP